MIRRTLLALADKVAGRLRASRPGRPDGLDQGPAGRLPHLQPVTHAARRRPTWPRRSSRSPGRFTRPLRPGERIRLLGVRVEGLAASRRAPRQLTLGEREHGWRDAERAADAAAARFGPTWCARPACSSTVSASTETVLRRHERRMLDPAGRTEVGPAGLERKKTARPDHRPAFRPRSRLVDLRVSSRLAAVTDLSIRTGSTSRPGRSAVPLSEHEQRLFEQIERSLAEDPKFASAVRATDPRFHAKRRMIAAAVLLLAGMALLVYGVAISLPLLGVGGFVVMLGRLGVWDAVLPPRPEHRPARRRRHRQPPRQATQDGGRRPPRGAVAPAPGG